MPVISHCSPGGKNNSVYTHRQEWEVWLWNLAWTEDATRKEPRLALGKQQHPTEVSSLSSDAGGRLLPIGGVTPTRVEAWYSHTVVHGPPQGLRLGVGKSCNIPASPPGLGSQTLHFIRIPK